MQLKNYEPFPATIPVICEDETFLYPFMIVPVFLTDEKDIEAINYALDKNSLIMISATKPSHEGERDFESCYDIGVVGSIMRKVALPDGRVKILFQGLSKGKILEPVNQDDFMLAVVDIVEQSDYNEVKVQAILEVLKDKIKALSGISSSFPADMIKAIESNTEVYRIADLVSSSIKLSKDSYYEIFSEEDIEKKLLLLIDHLIELIESTKIQKDIKNKVQGKIEKVNKEYFLKEQMKQIQKELGSDSQREEELEEYQSKLESIKKYIKEEGYKEIKKQIDRYSKMHPDGSEANLIQNYIETSLEIPFGSKAKKKLDIKEVQKQLDKDHYSLEKPKDRIVEFFAVKELLNLRGKQKDEKGTIICFAGPPGVGKTSLANSIANALKRKLVRVALGGLEDVNELRGHRRTYIGAMPGRIIQGLTEAGEMNPVMVLDEIDKVGRNNRGDPTSALLEILDPEQNINFRDHYLNFGIDLSDVVFIATANDVGNIPAPLRDRMEFINVSSYTPNEKYEIAKKYLLPQELKKHGLKTSEVSISKSALEMIIENYTREAGVRNLRRKIAEISRKVARKLLEDSKTKKISVSTKNIAKYLDKTIFEIDEVDKKNFVGIVNGLAWTAVGGDVLKVEVIKIKGKGAMQITGSLGDVMKESSKIAMSVVKKLIDEKKVKIDISKIPTLDEDKNKKLTADEIYKRYDLHVHVPEGATPKDGPSAGITMATAITSILSDRKVKSNVAMTGEITLTGKVLPIGGLKEKLIAAYKAKIKTALIPRKNYDRDLEDIPTEVQEAMSIIAVDTIEDVLKIALEEEK
jgi:ATP-dependent Lon protease